MTTTIILPESSVQSHHCIARWQLTFDEAMTQLRKRISDQDLFELGGVNTTEILSRADHHIPEIRQVLVFHPRFMIKMLGIDPSASVEAPLKFTVIERDNHVEIQCLDPKWAYKHYESLAAMATQLRDAVDGILAEL
jgi:uncharacterized protein (DUF302 family)